MSNLGAIILAAGKGTRMYPLTLTVPKVMLPVGGTPLLQWHIDWLKRNGVSDIAINLCFGAAKVVSYLGDGSKFDVNIHYLMENELLGTGLSAKRMARNLDEVMVVVYGDVLSSFNLSDMLKFHNSRNSMITLALFDRRGRSDVGGVELSPYGRCLRFEERPSASTDYKWANGGVYIVNKAAFDLVEEKGYSDFGHDVLPRAISAGLPVYGYKLGEDDYLLDIGTFERYEQANQDALAGRIKGFSRVAVMAGGEKR